jgi:hypothetical protein
MELPFDPTMEEASAWNLVGFAPNFDGKWIVREVVFSFTGKGGSRLEIELYAPPSITSPKAGVTTIKAKRALLNNTKIGGEPAPTPLNKGFTGGSGDQSWLPAAQNVALSKERGD